MAKGTVKTVTDKGYGFISTDDANDDVFYHNNSLDGELAERGLKQGDEVTFEIEQTDKGLNAVDIKLVE
jgi:CspA family cold shock protein